MAKSKHIAEILDLDEDMIRISGDLALIRLTQDCKIPELRARRILNIAWEFQNKAEPIPGGYVHVYYFGTKTSRIDEPVWAVVEHLGSRVAIPRRKAYTERIPPSRSGKANRRTTKGPDMPPRKRTAPPPEPEANGSRSKLDNLERYLAKDPTPVLKDYITWFTQNVSDPDELDSGQLIALAVTFYGEFQGSDFNRKNREARRAARATATEDEPEDEPAKPASRGRGRPRTATKPAAAAGPAKRGRPRKAATSGAAVY